MPRLYLFQSMPRPLMVMEEVEADVCKEETIEDTLEDTFKSDCHGIKRGGCTMCGCDGYDGGAKGLKCTLCGHVPGKHLKKQDELSRKEKQEEDSVCTTAACPSDPSESDDDFLTPPLASDVPSASRIQSSASAPHLLSCVQPLVPFMQPSAQSLAPPKQVSVFHKECTGLSFPTLAQSGHDPSSFYCSEEEEEDLVKLPHSAYNDDDDDNDGINLQQMKISLMKSMNHEGKCKLEGCNRSVCVEDGRVHKFCCRSHARMYRDKEVEQTTVSDDMKCKTPGCSRPRHANPKGGFFNYCHKRCSMRHASMAVPVDESEDDDDSVCILPECHKPKYRDPANNRLHDYCGRSHAMEAQKRGIQPQAGFSVLQATPDEFSSYSAKFKQDWVKGSCPQPSAIFVVKNAKLLKQWQEYKTTLPIQTTEEHYHGTKLMCSIKKTSCNHKECGICGIIRDGFDGRCIQRNISFQRFGPGFYLAPHSSKCHDYTQGFNGYRAMILFDVLPGQKHIIKRTDEKLTLPKNCHSVYGQTGWSLNYPELVLYNPDGAFPKCVIMYQKDGNNKIAT